MKSKQYLRLWIGVQTIAFLHFTTDDIVEIQYDGILEQYQIKFIHNNIPSTLWCDKYEWGDESERY